MQWSQQAVTRLRPTTPPTVEAHTQLEQQPPPVPQVEQPPNTEPQQEQPHSHQPTQEQDRQMQGQPLRVATLNVRGLVGTGRLEELAMRLGQHRVDLAFLQETKIRSGLSGTEREGYVFYASATERMYGVGVALRQERMGMLDGGQIDCINDRILVVRMRTMVVVGVYAPTSGGDEDSDEKAEFEGQLRAVMERHRHVNRILLGDFNGTMTQSPAGTITGANANGGRLEAYVADYDLSLQNWKWVAPAEAWTWEGPEGFGGGARRTIDWIAVSARLEGRVVACTTTEAFETDHRMVTIDFRWDSGEAKTWLRGTKPRNITGHRTDPRNGRVEEAWEQVVNKAPRREPQPRTPRQPFIQPSTWALIQAKYQVMAACKAAQGQPTEQALQQQLVEQQKSVKRAVAADREQYWEARAAEIEQQAAANNTAAVFRTLRSFYKPRARRPGFSRSEEEQQAGLEHFRSLLTDRNPRLLQRHCLRPSTLPPPRNPASTEHPARGGLHRWFSQRRGSDRPGGVRHLFPTAPRMVRGGCMRTRR